jgi:hypothetical protein
MPPAVVRVSASLLIGAYAVAALPAPLHADRTRSGAFAALKPSMAAPALIPHPHTVGAWPLEGLEHAQNAAMRLRGGSEDLATSSVGVDQHRHAVLAEQMGFGSHAFVLPLLYSLLAGLSTGIGGLLCLLLGGNTALEVPVTAFMLSTAAAAMITVSIVDLFMHIAEEIGLNHTLFMSIIGAITVILSKKIGNFMFASPAPTKGEKTEESEKKKSELRLLRVGLLTAGER